MPIAGKKTGSTSELNEVARVAKQFTHTDIETSKLVNVGADVVAMKKYITGYNWTVDYFSMITASDDRISTHDSDRSLDTTQQYSRILGLVLKLTEPLTNANYNSLELTAVVDQVLTPRPGDAIIGRLLDGSLAIFTVIKVSDTSYNKTKVFEVTFKFDSNTEIDKERYETLVKRVVRDYYALEGDDGFTILDPSTHTWKSKLEEYLTALPTLYNTFVEYGYPILRDNEKIIYDPYISQLYLILSRSNDTNLKESPVDLYSTQLAPLIGDFSPIKFKLSNATLVQNIVNSPSIRDSLGRLPSMITYVVMVGQTGTWDYPTTSGKILPNKVKYSSDRSYLYNASAKSSSLEYLIYQLTHRESLSRTHLNSLLDDILNWSMAQRYYYIPITLGILEYELRNLKMRGVSHV